MLVTQTTRNDAAIVSLSGRLDFNARHDFNQAIEKAKETGVYMIVLNMKDVSYIDSAALGLIAVVCKNMDTAKIRVVIAEAQDYVQKVFTLANLATIIKIYPSVDEAVSSRVPSSSPAIR